MSHGSCELFHEFNTIIIALDKSHRRILTFFTLQLKPVFICASHQNNKKGEKQIGCENRSNNRSQYWDLPQNIKKAIFRSSNSN